MKYRFISVISLVTLALSFSLSQSSQAKPLKGSIKDENSLRPSLEVIPGSQRQGKRKPYSSRIEQYAGGSRYSPGQRPPKDWRPRRLRGYRKPIWGRRRSKVHVIPPISSYTLTPRNGVMTFSPGYEIFSSHSRRGVSTFTPGHDVYTHHSHKGVTSYAPGFEATRTHSRSGVSTFPGFRGHSRGGGGISFAHGYGSVNVAHSHGGTIMTVPGFETVSVGRGSGVKHFNGKHSVSARYSRKGIVCWSPGYEVSVETPGLVKNTLGGAWSTGSPLVSPLASRPVGTDIHPHPNIFVQAIADPSPKELQARALLLPGLRTAVETNLNWKQWYKHVARVIYNRWKYVDVGPGIAKLQVTVSRDRKIDCRVIDFQPAFGVERDVKAETKFREAALKAVRMVNMYEIPEFPKGTGLDEVTFDVQMKRTVDGPAGIDVGGTDLESK